MKISRTNGINEDIKEQYEITIYDCHDKPIFKSDNLEKAALFYVTHITAYDYTITPHTSTRMFSDYVNAIAEELGCSVESCLSWDIASEKLFIYSDSSDDDYYFPYSKLKKLVYPNDVEDYRITRNEIYEFDRDTYVGEKVSKSILDIIRKESKDYNV